MTTNISKNTRKIAVALFYTTCLLCLTSHISVILQQWCSNESNNDHSDNGCNTVVVLHARDNAAKKLSSNPPTNKNILYDGEEIIRRKTWSDDLKVAIYMTTHMSNEHMLFLQKCWPAATMHLPLVRDSSLILYTSSSENMTSELLNPLGFHSIHIKHHQKLPYQEGAMQAMIDPFKKENMWFQNYDWVIRVNPDVLIREDTWLRQTMQNPAVDAILINLTEGTRKRLHTDFLAFRPTAIQSEKLFKLHNSAEAHIYAAFDAIIKRGRVAWLPNVVRKGRAAKVLGLESPVIHHHQLHWHCPDYLNATDGSWF